MRRSACLDDDGCEEDDAALVFEGRVGTALRALLPVLIVLLALPAAALRRVGKIALDDVPVPDTPLWIAELLALCEIIDVRREKVLPNASLRIALRLIHGWRRAVSGFIRRSGSQMRHLERKSMKSSSLQLRAELRVFESGRRRLPLLLTTGRGAPVESKKSFLREDRSISDRSGMPRISIIQASCSCSFSPGKRG